MNTTMNVLKKIQKGYSLGSETRMMTLRAALGRQMISTARDRCSKTKRKRTTLKDPSVGPRIGCLQTALQLGSSPLIIRQIPICGVLSGPQFHPGNILKKPWYKYLSINFRLQIIDLFQIKSTAIYSNRLNCPDLIVSIST